MPGAPPSSATSRTPSTSPVQHRPARLRSVDPSTGREIARYETHSADQLAATIAAVHAAQTRWAARPLLERAHALRALANSLRRSRSASVISGEMGKPLAQARNEIERCARICDHYGSRGPDYLADCDVATGTTVTVVRYEPLGVILGVMPWNDPFWQVFRCAAPMLLAGNAVLLKHAPNVSGCALEIERLVRDAGIEPDTLRALLIAEDDIPAVVDRIVADVRVSAVTVAGSVHTGRLVAEAAGRALKKCVLGLGGPVAIVVLEDADIEAASTQAAMARFDNAGQDSLAPKRIIVRDEIAGDFETSFARAVAAMPVGHPHDYLTHIGPLARPDLVDTLDRQVSQSVRLGARLVMGGHRLDHAGNYYTPTVLADVRPGMPVVEEATVGPVAAIMPVADDDEAVRIALDTRYGPVVSVWTGDSARGRAIGRQLAASVTSVNALVASDPPLHVGSVEDSGHERRPGEHVIWEFTKVRALTLDTVR